MKVDLFDFDLPEELIAQVPANPRESARLLHVGKNAMADRVVGDLPDLFRPGDVMVVNDTKVIPARLVGKRGDARMEVTLHQRLGPATWKAFAKPARKLKLGDLFEVETGLAAEVTAKGDGGEVDLHFNRSGEDLFAALHQAGLMPLPPYIKRNKDGDERSEQDRHDYQTVFAEKEGAVAAPTASLHFTDALLRSLDEIGVERLTVTLHVGAGTFLPVKVDDTTDHKMHHEIGILNANVAARVNAAREERRRVTAVGTTSLRLLESAVGPGGKVHPFDDATDLFITPGFEFRAVDRLLTNFHLPRSTLFMLVSAFAGLDQMKTAYTHAKEERYRFYSYGDCCLLER